jgi:hypothetical protein
MRTLITLAAASTDRALALVRFSREDALTFAKDMSKLYRKLNKELT